MTNIIIAKQRHIDLTANEKAYCSSCGKHWAVQVVEDGMCFMCSDMDDDDWGDV